MTTRILIVEDEDRARKNMVRLMESKGFDVFSGASATEARGLIDKNRFDVVVTDMLMEDEHAGISVLQAAKKKDDLTEVIVITAYGSIPNAVDSTKLGAFDYLEKDTDDINDLLCAKVEASINRKHENLIERSKTPIRHILEKMPPSTGSYDVMVIYNTEDRDSVESICRELGAEGIKAWFDKCNLIPGWMFLEDIERVLKCIKSVAIIIGRGANHPWNDLELAGFLQQCRSRKVPIIPVILDGVDEIVGMPVFLQHMTWADFRMNDPDPMATLVEAIGGDKK